MKRMVTAVCLFLSLGVVAARAAQSSRAGDPPRLIIESIQTN